MAILNILKYPNPILKRKCKSVRKIDPVIRKLIDDMLETMYSVPGIGLAAPQVAKLVRVITIDIGEGPIVFVNPKIIKKSGKQTIEEGCLCLPGLSAPVERKAYVKVKGLDKNGKPQEKEAHGLLATVLQHEIDHLDGIVFIDKVKDKSLIRYVQLETGVKEINQL